MAIRRCVLLAVLGLVLVVGSALGHTTGAHPAAAASTVASIGQPLPAVVTHDTATAASGDQSDDARPCVLRADCAGGSALAASGLLLAVAVAVPVLGMVPAATPVRPRPLVLTSALVAGRLFRPPQSS